MKRTFILTSILFLFCAVVMADESYVISATDGSKLIVKMYRVYNNQIRFIRTTTIETSAQWGIFNTAVMYRTEKNNPIFDVYYGICQDMECVNVVLAMKRLNSTFHVLSSSDALLPADYWWSVAGLATEKVQKKSETSYRVLMTSANRVFERMLNAEGTPGNPINVAFEGDYLNPTSSEDGKMVVAESTNNVLRSRTFHPSGIIRQFKQSADYLYSLTLSGPIAASAHYSKPYRLLLYRAIRDDPQGPTTGLMLQKIDNATGKPIGDPKVFKDFRPTQYIYDVHNHKSVAVTPKGNLVFYTQYDESCGKYLLFGQLFNPETSKNVGTPQILVGCDSSYDKADLQGIDVAEVQ
jgi:hypothetical protein